MKSTTVGVSRAILKALKMELRGGFCPYSFRTISIMLRYATLETIDLLEPKREMERTPKSIKSKLADSGGTETLSNRG